MNKYIQDWLDVIEYMNNDNTENATKSIVKIDKNSIDILKYERSSAISFNGTEREWDSLGTDACRYVTEIHKNGEKINCDKKTMYFKY